MSRLVPAALLMAVVLLSFHPYQVSAFHSPVSTVSQTNRAIRNPNHQICIENSSSPQLSGAPASARCRTSYVTPLSFAFRGGTGAKPKGTGISQDDDGDDKVTPDTNTATATKEANNESSLSGADGHRTLFGKAYGIYTSYLNRLWAETSTKQRQKIARSRATVAIKRVQHLMRGEEYADLTPEGNREDAVGGHGWADASDVEEEADPAHAYKLERARQNVIRACDVMLEAMGGEVAAEKGNASAPSAVAKAAEKIDPGESDYIHSLETTQSDSNSSKQLVEEKREKVDPGESQYLHSLDVEAPNESSASAEALQTVVEAASSMPPMMDPGSKTFTVDFPVDIATPTNIEEDASRQVAKVDNDKNSIKKKADGGKPRRSILFGATMGALVACWVFSGNYIFTGLFTLITILGQLEYYRMVINTGVYPARRISVLGACSMFITALFAPELHQACLPFFALVSMAWFLTMRHQVSTIPEISTTFTGMFLLGYVPSFWVRIRTIGGGVEPTRISQFTEPVLTFFGQKADALPTFLPKTVHLPVTTGSVFIFWTWLSLAFSDVGAYFVGRSMGKTKLGDVAPAAGAASPNKTVEGVMGGCAISALLSTLGAWVQRWPYWFVTGPIHGIYLGALGLLGDLTASMIKRDADIKDFGDLLPEHGGVMDRVDSYIFAAPYSWIMCKYLIPLMTDWKKAGHVAASAGLVGLMSVPLVWFFSLRKILQVVEDRRKQRKNEETL